MTGGWSEEEGLLVGRERDDEWQEEQEHDIDDDVVVDKDGDDDVDTDDVEWDKGEEKEEEREGDDDDDDDGIDDSIDDDGGVDDDDDDVVVVAVVLDEGDDDDGEGEQEEEEDEIEEESEADWLAVLQGDALRETGRLAGELLLLLNETLRDCWLLVLGLPLLCVMAERLTERKDFPAEQGCDEELKEEQEGQEKLVRGEVRYAAGGRTCPAGGKARLSLPERTWGDKRGDTVDKGLRFSGLNSGEFIILMATMRAASIFLFFRPVPGASTGDSTGCCDFVAYFKRTNQKSSECIN